MKSEYFRWSESAWHESDKDWRQSEKIVAGVDVGSVSSKTVILVNDELFAYSILRTGSNATNSAHKTINRAMENTGLNLENIRYIVGTGYGRVNIPFANKLITEIGCHARGANYVYPKVRTILDMGGQDCKAIHCDERGKVVNFLMNDKCAAGAGRGMEVMAELLGVYIEDIGQQSLSTEKDIPPVSSTCVVFAKSEAMSLLRSGWSKNEILAAYCEAMAHRIVNLLKRIKMEPDLMITGGIAKNMGIVSRVEKEMGIKAVAPTVDPQIIGALGAALFAKDLWQKISSGTSATRGV